MSEVAKAKMPKFAVIIIIVLSVVVVGCAIAAIILLTGGEPSEDGEPARTIGYQNEGVIILDEDDLDQIRPGDGMIDLSYKYLAESIDGVNFVCDIRNSASNNYDMYFNIYLDDTFEQQLLLTGLFPPGSGMEVFKSEIPLENGEYEAVLVMTQVDDDHATMVGQVSVVLTLVVHDEYEYEEAE